MNILIDLLPVKVIINSMEYEINSNFRTSILFTLLQGDYELSDENKIVKSLELYYPILVIVNTIDETIKKKQKNLLENYQEAIDKIIWFYRCGEEIKSTSKSKNKRNNTKLYDFEQDSNIIFSSFFTQYNIDLQDIEYMHWWKFMSLFESLKEDTKLQEAIKYRSIDLKNIKDKEERKYYKEMKKIYSLEDKISEEELEELEKEKDEWK